MQTCDGKGEPTLMMDAIILAGGRGTRLSGTVPDLPKPMAPVAGRPFVSYLLNKLTSQGFMHICLSTGYKADVIERYFGPSYGGAQIAYVRETSPLGTGGAIRAALPFVGAPDVFVLNGDTIADVDLRAMYAQHKRSGDLLTVALMQVPDSARYGTVRMSAGHIERFSEKGLGGQGCINVGIYLLRRDLFDSLPLPEVFSFEKEILTDRPGDLRPGAFLSEGYFIDIGIPEDYARAQHELPLHLPGIDDSSAGPMPSPYASAR